MAVRIRRLIANGVPVLDIPSRRIIGLLDAAPYYVKPNNTGALKTALMHRKPCRGGDSCRAINGPCKESWYNIYCRLMSVEPGGKVAGVKDFDTFIDFVTAFHTLTPMLDEVRVRALALRLLESGVKLDFKKLGKVTGVGGSSSSSVGLADLELDDSTMCKSGFTTCNCGEFLHYNWCIHVLVDALVKHLIVELPKTFRNETITNWHTGRIARASAGGARGYQ